MDIKKSARLKSDQNLSNIRFFNKYFNCMLCSRKCRPALLSKEQVEELEMQKLMEANLRKSNQDSLSNFPYSLFFLSLLFLVQDTNTA